MPAIHKLSVATLAAIALSCLPASSQTKPVSTLYAHYLPHPHHLGKSALGLGDIDGDGHDDYALGAPWNIDGRHPNPHVLFISGRTGLTIRTTSGWQRTDSFGHSMVRIHDVDADKVPDMLVGAPDWDPSSATSAGRVAIISVRTGKVVTTIDGQNANDRMGTTIAAAGDTNKDGFSDYLIASPGYPSNTKWGRVQVISGKDHKTVLRTYTGLGAGDVFGGGLAAPGDLDNDGYDDVVICGNGHTKVFSSRFGIQLKSMSVGGVAVMVGDLDGDKRRDLLIGHVGQSEVYGFSLPGFKQLFSLRYGHRNLLALPDLDNDGVEEFAIGDPNCCKNYYWGQAYVISGKTRTELYRLGGQTNFGYFGTSLAHADVDADGRSELIVGQPGGAYRGAPAGQAAWAFHLGKLPFTASRHWVSLAKGGTINFTIDGGTSRAGLMYMVAGSITGYKPGFDMWGVHIPLNPDPYFYITIGYPNNPFLSNSLGILDSAGKAVCTLKIPPNLKSKWTGITLDHAAVVFCKSPPMPCFIHLATNARPVTTVQ